MLTPHRAASAQHHRSTAVIPAWLQLPRNPSLVPRMALSSRRGSRSLLKTWRFSLAKFKCQEFFEVGKTQSRSKAELRSQLAARHKVRAMPRFLSVTLLEKSLHHGADILQNILKNLFYSKTHFLKIMPHPPLKSKLGLIAVPFEQGTTTKKKTLLKGGEIITML